MGQIDEKLKLLPSNPGVYVMLSADGQVIYVGKAKNLKNRVRQYFFNSVKTEKTMALVKNIADFYYIIAPSEIDALSLENNLIKKYKPRYNILLKDDKTYPYLRVDVKSDFPTFTITRKIKKDGAKYFGPFMGGVSATEILETLQTAFGIRPCGKPISGEKKVKPCLNYHIDKCSAPCAGYISKEDYFKRVKAAIEFLSGESQEAERTIKSKMAAASEKEDFELALKYRNILTGLEKIRLKRITSLNRFLSADVVACRSNGIFTAVNLLVVRGGRMLGGKNYSFECVGENDGERLSEFLSRYYSAEKDFPEEIIIETEIADGQTLIDYINLKSEKKSQLICPKSGVRKQLADMAATNATEHLEVAVNRIKHKDDMTVTACNRLKEILNLKRYPKRMECYDISNISGVDKVGSMVVFYDGEPARDYYRRFKIKTVEGANDFKSLQEVLSRRLERMVTDPDKFPKPDLIIIDGGKGQLSSVKEIFEEKGINDIDLISLAKREEEIFTVYNNTPVVLDKRDYCLKLLQRIRDEAHRFAITYFRSLHSKRELSSVLDGVNGLGKVRKRALLEKFKDLGGIVSATKEQLKETEGIGDDIAEQIIITLTKEGLR